MIHSLEYFNVGVRVKCKKIINLWLSDERFFGAVPEMDVGTVNGFQLVGIDVFVSVTYGFSFSVGPDLFALVQKDIEIM